MEGFTVPADEDFDVEVPSVNATFFHAMQEPVMAGRSFSEDDDATHPLVAVVNESFAKHYFTNPAAAVGRRAASGGGKNLEYMTIVGVTRDAKHLNLRDAAPPTLFTPLKQAKSVDQLYLYIRTATTPPEQTFALVRQTIKQIDAGLDSRRAANDGRPDRHDAFERAHDRTAGNLVRPAGDDARGRCLYGVLAFSTAQRTREIGIRIALGSTRLGVSRLVLLDVLRLAGIGVAVALPLLDRARQTIAESALRRLDGRSIHLSRCRVPDRDGGAIGRSHSCT